LAKVEGAAMELTYADRKKGRNGSRSPQQILRDARTDGDSADRSLINEYEKVTKGRRMLTMSRGLKAQYLVDEIDDKEIVEANVGGELLHQISGTTWQELVRVKGATSRLLRIVIDDGLDEAISYINQLITNHSELTNA
jgi:hypothetical protein